MIRSNRAVFVLNVRVKILNSYYEHTLKKKQSQFVEIKIYYKNKYLFVCVCEIMEAQGDMRKMFTFQSATNMPEGACSRIFLFRSTHASVL